MNKHILTVMFLLSTSLGSNAQINRALVVAIDKYPEVSGWGEIHGTNDASIVIQMLKANNFNSRNILYLENQQATKIAIVDQLKGLASTSKKGDYVYIHFSCHGQLMLDDNGDEPNGLDEALIPYDARRRFTKGVYEGNNHLRDDELGVLLDNLRTKLGSAGNLVVVLDACHSGTANRDGDQYIRGTTYVFAPEGYTLPAIDPAKVKLAPKLSSTMSTMTVFSGCEPDQINYEYKDPLGEYYGALSYSICSLLQQNHPGMTNRDLFSKLTININTMFAGKRWQQIPYFESTDENKAFEIGK